MYHVHLVDGNMHNSHKVPGAILRCKSSIVLASCSVSMNQTHVYLNVLCLPVKTFSVRLTKSQNLNVSRLAVVLSQSFAARCQCAIEDVVEAVPTDNAPTTSEWSTSLLHTKMRLILDVWWIFLFDDGKIASYSSIFMHLLYHEYYDNATCYNLRDVHYLI